jgi:hypothetical protein
MVTFTITFNVVPNYFNGTAGTAYDNRFSFQLLGQEQIEVVNKNYNIQNHYNNKYDDV